MLVQVSLTVDVNANTSLTQLEERVQHAGQEAMRTALKQGVKCWEEQHRQCPQCGESQIRVQGTVARTLLTIFGRVRLARRRFRCQSCHHRFCPSQTLLQGLHLTRVTQPLRDVAIMAGASWPYRHACSWLKRLSGADISAEEMRLLTNEQGTQCARRQQQETRASSQACKEDERCVIGMDGGWVCNRERRGGMEGKVAVIATGKEAGKLPVLPTEEMNWYEMEKYMQTHRHPPRQRNSWKQRQYVATFASAGVLGAQAERAVHAMGLQEQSQVVVADGAHWIKKQTDAHFAGATRILDWPQRCANRAQSPASGGSAQ